MLLPIAEAKPVGDEAAPVDHIAGQSPSHVLLVEDDPQVAELVDAMLHDLGHTVVRAGGVAEALDRLNQDLGIQLVLSDVIMPGGKSGVDLAEYLAAVAARPAGGAVLRLHRRRAGPRRSRRLAVPQQAVLAGQPGPGADRGAAGVRARGLQHI
jgi:CheY-like chemotaxis protein